MERWIVSKISESWDYNHPPRIPISIYLLEGEFGDYFLLSNCVEFVIVIRGHSHDLTCHDVPKMVSGTWSYILDAPHFCCNKLTHVGAMWHTLNCRWSEQCTLLKANNEARETHFFLRRCLVQYRTSNVVQMAYCLGRCALLHTTKSR